MTFRTRLLNHERLLGILVTMPVPAIAEICADAGFDWLFLDMEHGSLELPDVERIVQTVNDRCPCVVRVPINDRLWIGKVLDFGVSGLILPQVNSAEQAQSAVFAARYPPRGGRGIGAGRAARYGANLTAYLASAHDETALIAQIEHKDAVENVEAIAAVEGIDALMIGPTDLSASYGKPAQWDDAELVSAITRVREFARSRKMPISLFSPDAERARRAFADGFTLVPVTTDGVLLVRAAANLVKTIREALTNFKEQSMATVDLVKRERNTKRFAAGEIIFAEGDTNDNFFYVVEEGNVAIANHRKFLEEIGPGGFFGEMGLVNKKPRSATATAKTDCVLVKVNEGDFYFLIQHAPFFAIEMMQVLAERVRRNTEV